MSNKFFSNLESYIRYLTGRYDKGRYRIHPVGFHGDKYLIELVELLIKKCSHFVETGANVGTTLRFVADRNPHLECYSCEPDLLAYKLLKKNISGFTNCNVKRMYSEDFLMDLFKNTGIVNEMPVFWLDAHGYGFPWPLKNEISLITNSVMKAFILIDDFKVPDNDSFLFDEYNGQVCSYEYIQNSLNSSKGYRFWYPSYSDRTSTHHPLKGWVLIEFGVSEPFIPSGYIHEWKY